MLGSSKVGCGIAGPLVTSRGRRLDEQDGWTFWRFEMEVQMIGEEQAVEYRVDLHDAKIPSKQ
jgi:hypothetical protein